MQKGEVVFSCRFQEDGCSLDIGGDEVARINGGALNMGFRSEVKNACDGVFGDQFIHQSRVTDVALHKLTARILFREGEIRAIPS